MLDATQKFSKVSISVHDKRINPVGLIGAPETEAITMEPAFICARSSAYMLWLLACVFVGLLAVEMGVSLTLSPALGILFLLLSCLTQP